MVLKGLKNDLIVICNIQRIKHECIIEFIEQVEETDKIQSKTEHFITFLQ